MSTPLVLEIFGGEKCVTTLEDLEAVAKVIHEKAVRKRAETGNPSTLGAEIEGQISQLNANPDDTCTRPFTHNGEARGA